MMQEIFDENKQRILEESKKIAILCTERERLMSQVEKYDHDIEQKERKIKRCLIENKFIKRNNLL